MKQNGCAQRSGRGVDTSSHRRPIQKPERGGMPGDMSPHRRLPIRRFVGGLLSSGVSASISHLLSLDTHLASQCPCSVEIVSFRLMTRRCARWVNSAELVRAFV